VAKGGGHDLGFGLVAPIETRDPAHDFSFSSVFAVFSVAFLPAYRP
jgi:hypothetical protein